jgi:PAS domain S-box-containing protein
MSALYEAGAPLESVLCTEELLRRPAREPDLEKENQALAELGQALADEPSTILQTLAEKILEVCNADSAGLSLLTPDKRRFEWPAIAGEWQPHIGGGTPRDFGPCGDVLDFNTPLLFKHFEHRYRYFQSTTPSAEECLLVPFYENGEAIGTIWALAHNTDRKFDGEDLRLLQSLGRFASAAYQAVKAQRTELRYRRLFESAKDGILILDTGTGRIVDANPFICDLLDQSHDELCDKELWELGMFRDKLANQHAVRTLQTERYLRVEQMQLESSRGKPCEVEMVANAYLEGEHRVIQCNIRDITERVRLEKKTKEQADALADLHHRKDEFLAMLSHELRTPLAAISNAVQLLNRPANETHVHEQARGIVERKVAHLKHLVDDLLEVSRITTGRVQLRHDRIMISGIIERAIETVRPLMERRTHELTVSLPPQPVWLSADPARLEQVVVNLLTNAAKYSEERGHIWLTVERRGDTVELHVRDLGVGIAPDLLPHIFDLFTQAEPSLDRSEGGLGVGLCLVQRLVELHGGTVKVSSVLGVGSEFVVRLPALPELAESPVIVAPPGAVAKPAAGRCRVLIVDDDEDTAESLAMLLESSGHHVRMAHDGPAALEAALEYRPDVMLLDIGLPMLNGFEVAERVRKLTDIQNTVLVAVTGYGQQKDRTRTTEAGFDHHLVKPANFGEVEKILATVAAGRKS